MHFLIRFSSKKVLTLCYRLTISLCIALVMAALVGLVFYIVTNGARFLTRDLIFGSYSAANPSMGFAIITTIILVFCALSISAPLGVATAIYLVEYTNQGSRTVAFIRLATETLAGIPSIIYGLFGAILFNNILGFGYSIISGFLTLSIMILPVIIRTAEEALKSVPDSFREGSFALGAGKLRTLFRIILPAAAPGILASLTLSIGRIVGETAVLLFTLGSNARMPNSIFDSSRSLAIHMYINTRDGGMAGRQTAFAVGTVLIALVLLLNLVTTMLMKKREES